MEPSVSKPHRRRALAALAVLAFAGGAVGGGWALAGSRTTVVPLTMPVVVAVPAPITNVTLPAPVVQVTAPPPPPAPVVKEPPPPRAVAPYLDADCLLPALDPDADADGTPDDAPPQCDWDAGFPAVSADGKLVVVLHVDTDVGDGRATDAWLELVDTRSSEVVRRVSLFTSDDLARKRARAVRRIAAAQQLLDEGHFRTLTQLGDNTVDDPDDPTTVRVETAEGRVRIVDRPSATVLWQGRFGVDAPRKHDDDEDCGGWNLASTTVWWDPGTKIVLADLTYFTGGCMCPDEDFYQTRRF